MKYIDLTVPSAASLLWRRKFSFSRRAGRSEYWLSVGILNVFYMMILAGADTGTYWLYGPTYAEAVLGGIMTSLTLGGSFLVFLISLAVTVRRLHDTGRSGWWYLLSFIPVVGQLLLFFWLIQPSDGDNSYGPRLQLLETAHGEDACAAPSDMTWQRAGACIWHSPLSFSGRMGRDVFWLGLVAVQLVVLLSIIAAGISFFCVMTLFVAISAYTLLAWPPVIFSFVMIGAIIILVAANMLVLLSMSVRRLHDTGRSGWWFLVSLIPVVGMFILLWWTTAPSAPDNQYGIRPE